jgi:ATP-dependent Lon protease
VLAPRDMRRALVTAFGNARLDNRYRVEPDDLPKAGAGKGRIGFLQ